MRTTVKAKIRWENIEYRHPILQHVFYCLLFSLIPGTKGNVCRRVIETEVAAGGVLQTACVGYCLNEALGVLLGSSLPVRK